MTIFHEDLFQRAIVQQVILSQLMFTINLTSSIARKSSYLHPWDVRIVGPQRGKMSFNMFESAKIPSYNLREY